MHENFQVHTSLKSLLSTVSHYVSNTFCWYTVGSVPIYKAERMIEKFNKRYGVLDTKHQFGRKRRNGIARCRLILYFPSYGDENQVTDPRLDFVLLTTDGTGAVHEMENLVKVKPGSPLRYEKIVYRKEGGMRGGGRAKASWSWHFNQEFYKDIRESCIHAARMKDLKRASLLTGRLMAYPPFHGIRSQRASIFRAMRKTAIHAGHSSESLAFIPTSQFWVRKGRKDTVSLGFLQ